MKREVLAVLCSLAMVAGASAAPTISLVGDGDGYDEAGVNAFRSTGYAKAYDLNLDNVYGSEGLFFFGDGLPNDLGGNPFSTHTQVGAEWATFSAGANFSHIAEGATYDYAIIDDPVLIPVADVADWGIRSAVGAATTPAGAGSWCEILTFDIDETTPGDFRVGILAGNANNTNWNPAALRISVDGDTPQAVTNLSGALAQANFVFFDVALNGATNGTFSIEVQRRAATQGASLAGVTFDTTSTVTWPDGALLLEQDSLSLNLVAPDTSTNGTINALYLEGPSATDVEIISAVADAGFSASYTNSTLGTANTNEAIAVAFDNTSIGLANGESTNSTLVVTWTEVGSGVTNTSEAALNATYINVPNSLALNPDTLSLVLNAGDASTNGTVTASYVEGTLPADVEIVSLAADAGFSASVVSTTLGTGNTAEAITVTFTDPGGLAHNQVVSSTLVVSWTEVGSGVTNEANAALDVTYNDPPPMVEEWTIGIDFGGTAPAGATVFNQMGPYGGNNTTLGVAANAVLTNNSLVDITGASMTGIEFVLTNADQISWDFGLGGTGGAGGVSGGGLITNQSVYADALICNDAKNRVLVSGVDFMYFTFTGLDDSLTYNLSGGWDNNSGNFDATWAADGKSVTTDVNGSGGGYASLTGLSTDGSGNLVVSVTGDGDAAHITVAAMTLTAFSEAVTEIGNVSIGMIPGNVVLSWDGGGTYNVETNASLAFPNWGVLQSGSSPVTNAVGSEPVLFDRLSN